MDLCMVLTLLDPQKPINRGWTVTSVLTLSWTNVLLISYQLVPWPRFSSSIIYIRVFVNIATAQGSNHSHKDQRPNSCTILPQIPSITPPTHHLNIVVGQLEGAIVMGSHNDEPDLDHMPFVETSFYLLLGYEFLVLSRTNETITVL